MSVVKDFQDLKKYNVQELTMTSSEESKVQNLKKEPSTDTTSSCPEELCTK